MALTPFASVDRSTLRWLRSAESPAEFTLLSADSPIVVLRWKQKGGSLAFAETSERVWTLKRGGFLSPHITVREEGSEAVPARLAAHLSYHEVTIDPGGVYRFRRAGMLIPAWKLTTQDGTEVLHVEPVRDERKLVGGAVLAAPSALDLPDLLLLVVLNWYFGVLAWFEDEALAAIEGRDAPAGPATPSGS